MPAKTKRTSSANWDKAVQRGTWIVLALTVLLVVIVRLRLREMPLERDEGEYAYAGQLMLQGVPPYELAYNMKLPGTYAAYALVMAVFGQTTSAIHIGLLLVNVATIVLVFLLGRRMMDPLCGAVAAMTYGLLSTSPAFLGLAAHATQFVTLFAMAGLLVLFRAFERERRATFFYAGILLGLAFLMKQPGVFFGVFALAWIVVRNATAKEFAFAKCAKEAGLLAGGLTLPYLVTALVLWTAGVLDQFYFWTVRYAREYASAVPWSALRDSLHAAGHDTFMPSLMFWILSGAGAVMMWWEKRLKGRHFILLGLLLAGCAASSTGLYFREHYFIPMLPALGILCGVAVSRSVHLVRHEQSVELFVALAVLMCSAGAVGATLVTEGDIWFVATPAGASRSIYGSTLFAESPAVANYLAEHCPKDARVAVIGSEPQIYFYAKRRSATGHIYTYSLVSRHRFALQMQEEMIREVEQARPEYIVYVHDSFSWLEQPGAERRIFDWWNNYSAQHYEFVRIVNIAGRARNGIRASVAANTDDERRYFMIFKRKESAAGL